MSDEEFVRAHWKDLYVADINDVPHPRLKLGSEGFALFASWSAAKGFIESRLEEIRQVKEEERAAQSRVRNRSCWAKNLIRRGLSEKACQIAKSACMEARTLDRLQSILTNLKRGMKEVSDGR